MPIDFTCPHCGNYSRVDDQFAGRTGPCSQCGQRITIPLATPMAAKAAGGTSTLMILSIVGGVLVVGVLILGLLGALLWPAVNAAREAARRNVCQSNLRHIALAMQVYHDQYGSYPPAYIADENGQPMHSWRVLLLPFLGEQALYDQYDFSQPWDSPENLWLTQSFPAVYGCPSDGNAAASQETSYMVIVGPETAFPGAQAVSRDDISDGTASTILVVEVANSGVGWSQPVDLQADTISWQIDSQAGNSISSNHPGGANASFADGSVRFMSDQTTPEVVHALTTIAGQERTGPLP